MLIPNSWPIFLLDSPLATSLNTCNLACRQRCVSGPLAHRNDRRCDERPRLDRICCSLSFIASLISHDAVLTLRTRSRASINSDLRPLIRAAHPSLTEGIGRLFKTASTGSESHEDDARRSRFALEPTKLGIFPGCAGCARVVVFIGYSCRDSEPDLCLNTRWPRPNGMDARGRRPSA